MRKYFFLFLVVLLGSPFSWGQNPLLKKAAKTLFPKKAPPLAKVEVPAVFIEQNLQNSLTRVIAHQSRKDAGFYEGIFPPLEAYYRKSVFALRVVTLKGSSWISSGFVFEEEYQGQKILWGIVSEHATFPAIKNPKITFLIDGKEISVSAPIVVRGHKEFADIALVRLPESLKEHVVPLQLADFEPAVEQQGFSPSYFSNGSFAFSSPRKVLKLKHASIISSYAFYNTKSVGSCGAPFLINGVVVGVHCGSSPQKESSYAIKATLIPSLLEAAHNNGISLRQAYLNGKSIVSLNIDEGVTRITAFNKSKKLYTLTADKSGPFVDYNHLEKTIRMENVTDLYIDISKDNIFTNHNRFPDEFRKIKTFHYNVKTAESFRLTATGRIMFSYFNRLSPHHSR